MRPTQGHIRSCNQYVTARKWPHIHNRVFDMMAHNHCHHFRKRNVATSSVSRGTCELKIPHANEFSLREKNTQPNNQRGSKCSSRENGDQEIASPPLTQRTVLKLAAPVCLL